MVVTLNVYQLPPPYKTAATADVEKRGALDYQEYVHAVVAYCESFEAWEGRFNAQQQDAEIQAQFYANKHKRPTLCHAFIQHWKDHRAGGSCLANLGLLPETFWCCLPAKLVIRKELVVAVAKMSVDKCEQGPAFLTLPFPFFVGAS